MKIRRRWLIKALGFAGAWVVRVWMWTLRYRYHPLGLPIIPPPKLGEHYIYAFWHENMLLPAYHCGCPHVWVLVSRHADGEMIAAVCRSLGFRLVRGSTTRGSVEAVRQMLRAGQDAHLAVTPDGPRGPRRHVQAGVIYLAAKTGLAIIAGGIGFQDPWRLRSWDQFVLPKPWRRATVVTSPPIRIPPNLDKDSVEYYRRLLEDNIRGVTLAAERWAEQGGEVPALEQIIDATQGADSDPLASPAADPIGGAPETAKCDTSRSGLV
jgi:lysophospholipid acyltransferase (LPLAT)-like uncharacterized protein